MYAALTFRPPSPRRHPFFITLSPASPLFEAALSLSLSYQHLEDTTVIRPITLKLATRVTEFLVLDATCRYLWDVTAAPTSLQESSATSRQGVLRAPIPRAMLRNAQEPRAGTLEFPSFSRAYRHGESARPSRYQEEARLSTLSNVPGILAAPRAPKSPLFAALLFAQLAPRRGGRLCRRISGRREGISFAGHF